MSRPIRRRVLLWALQFRVTHFLIDVWSEPRLAWRNLWRKRTWPSPKEFAAMGQEEFEAYLDSIDMLPGRAGGTDG